MIDAQYAINLLILRSFNGLVPMLLLKKDRTALLRMWRQVCRAALWAVAGVAVCAYAGACSPDRSELIQREVGLRVAEFRKKKARDCQNALLSEAERMVDSLLLSEAKAALADSLLRGRPVKPLKPAPIPPVDSATVKPIFTDPHGKGK